MRANVLLAPLAAAMILMALWQLQAGRAGVSISAAELDGTPLTVFRPATGARGPAVLIAHGFAGSQQLMQSFALTFARNGYVAVTFDFPGHGRNPHPLTGNLTDENGATRTLVEATRRIAGFARAQGDGRLAVLGHSMASDIVVRFAETTPDIDATIAVSMLSPVVTATAPRNLLVIVGDWEGTLKREALRAVSLATAPRTARDGVTYGDPARGTGRRAAFSAHVEHASVLFSRDSMRESLDWLDRTFGVQRSAPPQLDGRGPWILLLLAGSVLLARPLASLLPRLASPPAGAGLAWRRLWVPLTVPMVATPLLLRFLPTHFLPVLVGDYLAAHFATYGLLTALCLAWQGHLPGMRSAAVTLVADRRLVAASLAVIAYGFVALSWPINALVTSFVPGPGRAWLLLAMFAGTLSFFLGAEWVSRGPGAARGAYVAVKVAFLVSLGLAVALDFERLFFLVIIVPVIALFFIIYGLFSRWTYRATGQPLVAAIANAVAFGWAISVTFPLWAG
jgi:pimeloyl-ACP methyl ester carboxylesterase